MTDHLASGSSRPDFIGSTRSILVHAEGGSDVTPSTSSSVAPVRADASAESTSPVVDQDSYKWLERVRRNSFLTSWRYHTFSCFIFAFATISLKVRYPFPITSFGLYVTYAMMSILVLASVVTLSLLIHAEVCVFRCRAIPALYDARLARIPFDCFRTSMGAIYVYNLISILCKQPPKTATSGELVLYTLYTVMTGFVIFKLPGTPSTIGTEDETGVRHMGNRAVGRGEDNINESGSGSAAV